MIVPILKNGVFSADLEILPQSEAQHSQLSGRPRINKIKGSGALLSMLTVIYGRQFSDQIATRSSIGEVEISASLVLNKR
jgi:hypothetical protein